MAELLPNSRVPSNSTSAPPQMNQRGHQKDALQAGIVVHAMAREGLGRARPEDSGSAAEEGFCGASSHPFSPDNLRTGQNDDQGFKENLASSLISPHPLSPPSGWVRRC